MDHTLARYHSLTTVCACARFRVLNEIALRFYHDNIVPCIAVCTDACCLYGVLLDRTRARHTRCSHTPLDMVHGNHPRGKINHLYILDGLAYWLWPASWPADEPACLLGSLLVGLPARVRAWSTMCLPALPRACSLVPVWALLHCRQTLPTRALPLTSPCSGLRACLQACLTAGLTAQPTLTSRQAQLPVRLSFGAEA